MNNREIISNLLKEISKIIDDKIIKKQCDKTFKTTIWKINEDNTYSINYKGQLYNVQNASGISLSIGDSVWVKIPDGILRNMYIESVPNTIITSSGETGGDGHTHNNKSILDSITSSMINMWNTVTNKVDKVDGKGLSSNDLTDELKAQYDKAEENVQSDWNETDETSDAYINNKPTALPANGGNADTVNNCTVEKSVPADAKFTDTIYTHPSYTARTGVPTANQAPTFGGTFTVTQPKSDATGHITAMTNRTITIPNAVATESTLGLVKSGTDITVDSNGNVSVNDDSHNHTIANVDGLQSALNAKASLSSPTLTGTPKAPTADSGTNTTQIATTAFVQTAKQEAISAILGGTVDADFDTLQEVANWIQSDTTNSASLVTRVTNLENDKADLDDLNDYIPWTGGTMVGYLNLYRQLQMTDDADKVKTVIRLYNPTPETPSAYGSEIVMGAGGNVFIGSGESETSLRKQLLNDNADGTITKKDGEIYTSSGERTYISSDAALMLYSNLNTPENRKAVVLSNTGHFYPLITGQESDLGTETQPWRNVYANGAFIGDLIGNATGLSCTKISTKDTNLDDYKTSGVFYFSGTYTPVNIPFGTNGFLIVITNDTQVKQFWLRHGTNNSNDYNTAIRFFNGTSWSDWRRFLMSGESLTAAKLTSTLIEDKSSETWLTPLTTSGVNTGDKTPYIVKGITLGVSNGLEKDDGTISDGRATIALGNGTSKGTIGNQYGTLRLYSKQTGYANLMYGGTNGTTKSANIWLPDTAGTLALDTEATTSVKGLMSSDDKTKLDNTNIAYGTCSTTATTSEKVITISGNTNWKLTVGSEIVVKFTETNTAQNPTFNVNGTGAKKVWYNTALITTSNLGYAGYADRLMKFTYDGTQYVFMGWSVDTNTDTKNTAGSTNSNSKLFLVGTTSQTSSARTYSHDTAYVGTDGCLYSGGSRVVNELISASEPTTQTSGDHWLLEY